MITTIFFAYTSNRRRIRRVSPRVRIFDAKRLIGRKFHDSPVQADMKHWPFKVLVTFQGWLEKFIGKPWENYGKMML